MPSIKSAILACALAVVSAGPLSLQAFGTGQHRSITEDALKDIRATIAGAQKGFADRALKAIKYWNTATDDLPEAALFRPQNHFTNEAFGASSDYLITLRRDIIALARGQTRPRSPTE